VTSTPVPADLVRRRHAGGAFPLTMSQGCIAETTPRSIPDAERDSNDVGPNMSAAKSDKQGTA
jgi:hypothetical protein